MFTSDIYIYVINTNGETNLRLKKKLYVIRDQKRPKSHQANTNNKLYVSGYCSLRTSL